MPSPFPGMDPYLEDPILWPGVHQGLITYARAELNRVLPPHYVADIGERLYVLQPEIERNIYPDVLVLEQISTPKAKESGLAEAATAVADPPLVLTMEPVEMREVFIQILSLREANRVVTVIEVLSPSNKTANSQGRQLYLTKQREILDSQTHLIEIDLLRQGEHTVAIPLEALLQKGIKWDYLICLHRAGHGRRYEVWTIRLRQRLPRIWVPLSEGDCDVVLDLQKVFDHCYDEGAYARLVNYRRKPPTLLEGDDAEWANALLRERGLSE